MNESINFEILLDCVESMVYLTSISVNFNEKMINLGIFLPLIKLCMYSFNNMSYFCLMIFGNVCKKGNIKQI
jgi:hypothetical protein